MIRKIRFKNKEEAVSPVVGVMLMLVVTIIIAAVVSAFAGGLATTSSKAPTLAMDVTIKNTGYAPTSYILFDVQSVSDQIQTKDLKIVTSWKAQNGTVTGGNITAAGLNFPNTQYSTTSYQSPLGFGKGVTIVGTSQKTSGPYDQGQYFGNYTLTTGTSMKNSPGYVTAVDFSTATAGYGIPTGSQYTYSNWNGFTDGMQAILGSNWNATRPGDIVTIIVTHVPSGKVIFNKDVVVQG